MVGYQGHHQLIVGQGDFRYEVVADWPKLPSGYSLKDVAGVCVDSKNRVYVFHRGNHPVLIFDEEGNFVTSWGDGLFHLAHNIRFGPDGMMYCVDFGDHTVRKLSTDGKLLMTLGHPGKPSETGAVGFDYRTIKRVSGPFNAPTDVAFGVSSRLYVADGYGNARIHVFSSDGKLLKSWGEPGTGQNQFNVLHAILIDTHGRILVADRENSRVQVLSSDGVFVTEWGDANRPAALCMDKDDNFFVGEMGYVPESLFPNSVVPNDRDIWPRLTIRSSDGKILSSWGGKEMPSPGNFYVPHSACIDSNENLYVADVVESKYIGDFSSYHPVQKFMRVR